MDWTTLLLGIFLGVLLLPLALALVFRLFLWWFMRRVRRVAQTLAQTLLPPMEIELEPLHPVTWHLPEVESLGMSLQSQGFSSIGAFQIKNQPGTRLSGWLDSAHQTYGIIYEHPQVGCWCDLVSLYPDGSSYTTSSSQETGLDHPPQHPQEKSPGSYPDQLQEIHLQNRPPQARSLCAEDFASSFQRCYAESMLWRAHRGTRRQEIVEFAQLQGETVEAETTEKLALQEQLAQHFLSKTSLSPGEWEEVKDRLVFVYDEMEDDELRAYGLNPQPGQTNAREKVRGQGQFLGTLHQPVEADVYALEVKPPHPPAS